MKTSPQIHFISNSSRSGGDFFFNSKAELCAVFKKKKKLSTELSSIPTQWV